MSFSIQRIPFDRTDVDDWAHDNDQHTNWPVVYVIDGADKRRTSALRGCGRGLGA